MPTALLGADADQLDRIAHELRSVADELDGHAGSLTATLRSVAWVGGVATRFADDWHGGHRPRIVTTARYVRDAAAQLDRNAAEQRAASRSGAGGPGGVGPIPQIVSPPIEGQAGAPGPGGVGGGGSSSIVDGPSAPLLDRLGRILDVLGAERGVLELLGEHVDLLDGAGVDRLVELLSNDGFLAVLDGLDAVVDVGSVVVNLVSDFVEHPHLPSDERIVHALADAATRFGVDQGVEYAASFLAQAATAALLPGLGAALAPFVGKAAGVIADAVIGAVIEAVDGATDFVDVAADAAVEAYRAIKETFGVLLDATDAVVDVAGAAVDLTMDAAGAVVGGIADAGGSVGSWLGI